jgi:hypothetical protein
VLDVCRRELNRLRNSGARIVEQREEQIITPACPCGDIDCGKERFYLVEVQETEYWPDITFARNSEDTLSIAHKIRRHVAEYRANKSANSSEAGVASPGGIEPLGFEILQESQDGIWRKCFLRNPIDGSAAMIDHEAQQQSKGVSVGRNGVVARLMFGAKMGEESLQERLKAAGCHNWLEPGRLR